MKEIDLEILRQDAARGTFKDDAVDDLWRKKLQARRAARVAASADRSKPDSSWTGHEGADRHMNGSSHHQGDAGGQVPH
jgi:hypothetical protein